MSPRSIPRPALCAAVLVAASLVAACGDPAARSPGGTPGPAVTPETTVSPDPSASPTPAGSPSDPAFDPAATTLIVEPVTDVPGGPLGVTNAGDGTNRLFVTSQDGRIWVVRDGERLERPFLAIEDRLTAGGERGLLGLAFHPDYPQDPRFFVNYTDREGDTVVASYRVSDDPDAALPASEQVILRIGQPYGNHNGGAVAFGPDGYLYIATGDGGSGGDPQGHGQRVDTLLGKILRIDVDAGDGERPYAIPGDNPFAAGGGRPEIWLTGLRNPWRMSFDRETGDLWIGDVGQGQYEEINVHRAGEAGGTNYGWARMEGFHCFPSGDGCNGSEFTLPVTEYGHEHGCAVTGGYVYRGAAHPELAGAYVFADYCSGILWAIDARIDEEREPTIVGRTGRRISSFGEDEAGEMYVTDLSGSLLRVAPGS